MKLTSLQFKQIIKEAAAEYLWGVKGANRIANQYKISVLKLNELINEEINRLFEQPDVTPASFKPNVKPAGATMDPIIDAGDIENLEKETEEWRDEDEELADKAEMIGVSNVDPRIIDDYLGLSDTMLRIMMDVALERYREENQPSAEERR